MFDFENVMILQRGRGITGQYGSNGRAPQRKRGMDKTNIYIYIYGRFSSYLFQERLQPNVCSKRIDILI